MRGDQVPQRPDVSVTRGGQVVSTVTVLLPPTAFVVPFFGPLVATVCTVVFGAVLGVLVWPVRRWVAVLASIAVVLVIVLVIGVLGPAVGMGDVLGFQLVPLCGPDPGSVWVVAALVASLGYGAVALASVRLRRIWLWPVAAAAGAGLYLVTWRVMERVLDAVWIC